MKIKNLFLFLFCVTTSLSEVYGAYTLQNGKIVNADLVPTMTVEEHYTAGTDAFNNDSWGEAIRQFLIVTENFPSTPYAQESTFYLAVSYFNLCEYDIANSAFSSYLQGKEHPRLFMETMEFKFAIAEKFRNGARRRFFGTQQLPKWATGGTLAISIYDEVIAAMPCHDLAAWSLYSKALLHRSRREFNDSINALQIGLRRFPRHELAPEFYLLISQIYLDQCRLEFQNPDILAFAEINLQRFKQRFPREQRLAQAEADFLAVKEVYAGGLLETGYFYERICKPKAAALYYQTAIRQFPDTNASEIAISRLTCWGFEIPKPDAKCASETIDQESVQEKIQGDDKIDWIP
jgi:outer membrane protein assembly factor BamD (BamD/ComL family)